MLRIIVMIAMIIIIMKKDGDDIMDSLFKIRSFLRESAVIKCLGIKVPRSEKSRVEPKRVRVFNAHVPSSASNRRKQQSI